MGLQTWRLNSGMYCYHFTAIPYKLIIVDLLLLQKELMRWIILLTHLDTGKQDHINMPKSSEKVEQNSCRLVCRWRVVADPSYLGNS